MGGSTFWSLFTQCCESLWLSRHGKMIPHQGPHTHIHRYAHTHESVSQPAWRRPVVSPGDSWRALRQSFGEVLLLSHGTPSATLPRSWLVSPSGFNFESLMSQPLRLLIESRGAIWHPSLSCWSALPPLWPSSPCSHQVQCRAEPLIKMSPSFFTCIFNHFDKINSFIHSELFLCIYPNDPRVIDNPNAAYSFSLL